MHRIVIIASIVISFLITQDSAGQSALTPLSRLHNVWCDVNDVVVAGNYAYVAAGWSGIQIIDISDPSAPHQVGIADGLGEITTLATNGGLLAAIATEGRSFTRVVVLSLEQPDSPIMVAESNVRFSPFALYNLPGLTLSDEYVFVSTGYMPSDCGWYHNLQIFRIEHDNGQFRLNPVYHSWEDEYNKSPGGKLLLSGNLLLEGGYDCIQI